MSFSRGSVLELSTKSTNYGDHYTTDEGVLYTVDVIAKLLNLTPRRVQQLADEGVIPRPVRGQYHLVRAIQGYVIYLQGKVQARGSEHKQRLDAAKAEERELLLAIRRGSYILIEKVNSMFFAQARVARNALMSLADKLAPLLAIESDTARCHQIIADAVRELCEDISRGIAKLKHDSS